MIIVSYVFHKNLFPDSRSFAIASAILVYKLMNKKKDRSIVYFPIFIIADARMLFDLILYLYITIKKLNVNYRKHYNEVLPTEKEKIT